MIRTQSFLLPSLALAFAGGAFAQGDDCSTAAALVGTGTFSYDTTGLTTSGYLGGACGGFNLNYDGFFQWTAPAAGDYSFDTFGTSYDTTLQVAAGVGCAATCIAFNDDSGGFLQSNVAAFGLLAGDSILIQVAGYSATTGFGPGSLTITALASAGPTDTCGTAGTLTGVGTFSYDTTANTTSLFNGGGGCGAVNLNVDAFFQWTAPANGDYNIDTVGTSYDTKLAVHSGVACGATCLDYNDDTFGLQSQVSIVGATAGDQFLIQVGGYNATHFGPGTLNITTYVDPCSGASDDSFEENDDCATAAPVGDGTYPGLFINTADGKDTFSTCVLDGATITVDILFTDSLMDLDLFLWDAGDANCGTGYGTTDLANGFSTTDNETVTYTNLTGATQNITIEVDVYLAGTQDCNMYDLVVSGSGGCAGGSVGTPFCDPMNPNSTGASTHLAGTFGTGVGSDLHLEATSGPPTQFGYFLIGTGPSDPGIVVSQGRLCLAVSGGNVFGRYNVPGGALNSVGLFDAGGVLQNLVSTSTVGSGFDVPSTVPITGSPTITAGSTWHFQLWHRENAGASNFSNGLSVTF